MNCFPDISPHLPGAGQHQTVPDRQCAAVHGFMTAGKPKSRFNVFRDHNGHRPGNARPVVEIEIPFLK